MKPPSSGFPTFKVLSSRGRSAANVLYAELPQREMHHSNEGGGRNTGDRHMQRVNRRDAVDAAGGADDEEDDGEETEHRGGAASMCIVFVTADEHHAVEAFRASDLLVGLAGRASI